MKPRLSVLIRLRLQIARARLATVPAWQLAFFSMGFCSSMLGAVVVIPMFLPLLAEIDQGLIPATLLITASLVMSFGMHLLIAESTRPPTHRSRLDPMDLLPVPPRWSFFLRTLEEMVTDPAIVLFVVPVLAGISLSGPDPGRALLMSVPIAVSLMALTSGVRITAGQMMSKHVTPEHTRLFIRGGAYLSLLVTIALGGSFLYDVFTAARMDPGEITPISLITSRAAVWLYQQYLLHSTLAATFPLSWPGAALLTVGGPWMSVVWLLAVLGSTGILLELMARYYAYLLLKAPVLPGKVEDSGGESPLARGLARWMPSAPRPLVVLETEMALLRGLMAEAIAESVLLVLSLALLLSLSPHIYGQTFVDALRTLLAVFLVLVTPPASSIARETAGWTLRRTLPFTTGQLMLARLPVFAFRNVLLVTPAALALPFLQPPASPSQALAAGCLIFVICVASALAAIAAGTVNAEFEEETSSFASQLTALLLCTFALTPLIALALKGDLFQAAAGVVASGMMIGGLMQKARCRIEGLAYPRPGEGADPLFGDAALGALLYFLLGNTLVLLFQLSFPDQDLGRTNLIEVTFLQLLTMRYAGMYLEHRRLTTGEARGLWGGFRAWGGGGALGIVMGLGAILYGYTLSRLIDMDPGASHPLTEIILKAGSAPLHALLAVVVATMLAPIAEEILFRRMLFHGLIKAGVRSVTAALLASLMFACIHPPIGFMALIVMSLTSCWLYRRTGNLGASIGFHMGFNSIQIALLVYVKGGA